MRSASMNFLKTLLTTPSPSGFESAAQRIWCDYVKQFADEVTTDAYGNAIAVINPGKRPRILFEGHMDEIGLMVKHITKEGMIYVQSIGGVDPALVRGKRVNIHTAKGVVRGVIGATAIHLRDRGVEPKLPKMHEIFVDVGAKDDKDARKQLAVGDPITFVDDFEMLNKNIAVARALDDRIGCWIAAEVLRQVATSKVKPKCSIYAVSSIQEETGCHGAAMNVCNVKPDAAIITEVTHATDSPGIDPKRFGEVKLGEGPTVSIGREHHPVLVRRLRDVAKKEKIDIQIETFSNCGGTDAIAMWTKNGGTPASVIGLPLRYMHSTVEMADLRDLTKAVDWLTAFAQSVKANEEFKVKV
jgi:putative aminopeptidase FrvX